MMHVVDKDGIILWVSDQWLRRLKYARLEVVGRNSFEFLSEESVRTASQERPTRLMARGRVSDLALTFVASDGEHVPVLLSATADFDDHGRYASAFAVLTDLTDLRIAQKEAERQRTLLDRFFQAIPDPTILTDTERRIIRVNPAVERVFGYKPKDLVGRTTEILHPDRDAFVRLGAERYRPDADETYAPYDSEYRRQDGQRFAAETVGSTIHDERAEHLGNFKIIRDVSQDHALRERVREAQRNESLGLLAGGIAHEFNNLLVGILGNADIACADLSRAHPAHQPLDDLIRNARRAANLCHQLLAYAGRGRFVVGTFDINDAIRDVHGLLSLTVGDQITLDVQLGEGVLAVNGDACQLRQALLNLVHNAADALKDVPGALIELKTYRLRVNSYDLAGMQGIESPEGGEYIVVEVADNGIGIERAHLGSIFDPFFTTRDQGRGLGLPAVLGIVRSHHGMVDVASGSGTGTCVRVLIPKSTAPPSRPLVGKVSGQRHVLVVDDDGPVRRVLDRMLTRMGFQVSQASDGLEGLQTFEKLQDQVDAVLLDLTMPNMNGRELYEAIKALDPSIPVILMSGYHEGEIHRRFADAQLAAFLHKPFRTADLQTALATVFPELSIDG